jgi:hypothetical protein
MLHNVELIRVPNDGAARATHETCLRKTSDPMIVAKRGFDEATSSKLCPGIFDLAKPASHDAAKG